MADKEDSDIDEEDDTFSVVSQSKANIFGYMSFKYAVNTNLFGYREFSLLLF